MTLHRTPWQRLTRWFSPARRPAARRSARPRVEPLEERATPALAIGDATVVEGSSGNTVQATFTVTLAPAATGTVTVLATTVDTTAVAPGDYVAVSQSLTFAPGETTKTVLVDVLSDSLDEANETYLVMLSNANGDTISDSQGVGTITDDDAAPTVSVGDGAVTEGASGTTSATFTVALSSVSGQTVTIVASTADGTAQAPSDYAAVSQTLTFAPGTTQQTVVVAVNGDASSEGNEIFLVNLSAPSNVTLADFTGVGTIIDDDPALSVADISAAEGNSGTTPVTFTVRLSPAATANVTVVATTSDGTASAPGDYATRTETLTFTPGETAKLVTVDVVADTVGEPNETFTLKLSAATGANLSRDQATATVTNDDPALTISDVALAEGNSGTTAATFTVTLTPASTQTVTVVASTVPGTATSPADFAAVNQTLTFAPGTTTQTVVVSIVGDTVDEPDEAFAVNLSAATNATVVDATGSGTIGNDEVSATLSISDVSFNEGNTGLTPVTFNVRLSLPFGLPVTVAATVVADTAISGVDYVSVAPQTLTFAPGETLKTVVVNVVGDTIDEPTETFRVVLTSATNAAITRNQAVGTIINDDGSQGTAAQCFVRQLFRDLLGREPDSGGLNFFANALDDGDLTRAGAAKLIQSTDEYQARALDALFQRYLGRSVDPFGRQAFLAFLDAGGTFEGVTARVLGSAEYFARAGGTNDRFLDAVYRDTLGRAVDAGGRAGWGSVLAAGVPRPDVVATILASDESNRIEVTDLYRTFLRRAPDAGGQAAFVGLLNGGADNEVVRSALIGSQEFFDRFCAASA